MPETFDPSSSAQPVHVPHEGELFMQRLSGRMTSPPAYDPPSSDPEALDLDQRVRNVGEW